MIVSHVKSQLQIKYAAHLYMIRVEEITEINILKYEWYA